MGKKILINIVRWLFICLLSPILLFGIMRDKHVQSFIAQVGSVYLSEYLGTKVWFDKFLLSADLSIEIENVHILDHHQNPLITAKHISADYHLIRFDTDELPIDNLKVDSAFVNLVQYQGESQLNINTLLENIGSSDTTSPATDSSIHQPIRIALGSLALSRSHFVFHVQGEEEAIGYKGMDYMHLDLKDVNTDIADIHLVDDSITARINRLSTYDRCGFGLLHLEGDTKVWPCGLHIANGNIKTERSDLQLDLQFSYKHWGDYTDFIDKVYMKAQLKRSKLNLQDIAYFAPSMWGMDNQLYIKGMVKGYVNNLKGRQLNIAFAHSTTFRGDIEMRGLPNIYETFVNLDVSDFSGRLKDIEQFKLPQGQTISQMPDILTRLGKIRLQGNIIGFYNDFVSNTQIYTEMGSLSTDLQIRHNFEENRVHYQGLFNGHQFNISQFIQDGKDYGIVDFKLELQGKGIELKTLDSRVTGQIDGLAYNHNPLNSIYVDAVVKDKHFDGSLRLQDELIQANFLGKAKFSNQQPEFNFQASLQNIKTGVLGLFNTDSSTLFSSKLRMNFTGKEVDDILGHLFIDSTYLHYKGQDYHMQQLHLSAIMASDTAKHIRLQSDIADGHITGHFKLSQLASLGQNILHHYLHQVPFDSSLTAYGSTQQFRFDLQLKQANTLSRLLLPAIRCHDSLHLYGRIQSQIPELDIHLNSPHIRWNSLGIDQPQLHLFSSQNTLQLRSRIHELWWQQAASTDTALRLGLDSIQLNSQLADDRLDYKLQWHNTNTQLRTQAHIPGYIEFDKTKGFHLSIDSAWVYINNNLWRSHAIKGMQLDTNNVFTFNNFQLSTPQQSIILNGALSSLPQQQLQLQFLHFNIATFNILSPMMGNLAFNGQLNGQIQVNYYANKPNLLASLWLEDFALNGTHMGDLSLQSAWKTSETIALHAYLEKQGKQQAFLPLELEGEYSPYTQHIKANIKTWQLPLLFLNPFLQGLVSDLQGRSNGHIQLEGPLLSPKIQGKLRLERTQFRIDYLNTLYSLSGDLHLNEKNIGFQKVSIYDSLGHSATLYGGLTHHNFHNFGVNLRAKAHQFSALNTKAHMNELFYGDAIISGDLAFKGPFDNIFMQLNLSSHTGSHIHIPLNLVSDISDNDFIIFTNKADSSHTKQDKAPELSSFTLNMQIDVDPQTEISISMPEDLGIINAQGNGTLNMDMSRTGNFNMSGAYTVASGEFFFNMRNLFNRRFQLSKGGTINWMGDPYDGRLNMKATYKLKTILDGFENAADTNRKTRVPVECVIGLKGKLTNPDLRFKVNMPNTTEDIRQYVYSQLDTTNQSQMSQQMLSLLILNSFNFSNSFQNSSSMGGNMSGSSMQIFTNQIGNLLSQISDKVDVGINYIPGSTAGNDELEVALSTQLFDDRISIDGNFGYQNTRSSEQNRASNLVGDIKVEVKLTKDGNWRLKVFNKSNTIDLLDNTSPYTQGVGIFYRRDFNRFSDLFRRKSPKIKKDKATD